jgi:NAD(P)-dependent dehydrogenase (short-subunit alcohol dehydrogenase family)
MPVPHDPVLIFGAVGGIGEALARRLHAAGVPLALTSRTLERVQPLADELAATALVCDVLDEAAITHACATAAPAGRLGGLVYAVGSIPLKPLARTQAQDMLAAYQLNVVGAMLALRESARALKAAAGSAVLFSSIAATQGFPSHAAIGAAKGAVEALVRTLAAELAPSVRINAIAPSLTATPLAEAMTRNANVAEAIAALHPVARLGAADEMAALAQFLLSPDAGWISGQILHVDGGRSTLRVGKG